MKTAFAGPFEDDNTGFKPSERARITAGPEAGKFGVIQSEVVPGYYHVRLEGSGRDLVLEYNEMTPVIAPVLVAGGQVRQARVTAHDIADEIVETITRLAKEVTVPEGQHFEGPVRDELVSIVTELDDVIIDAVSAQVKIRRAAAARAALGVE